MRRQRDDLQIQIDRLRLECAELDNQITLAQEQHKEKTDEANSFLRIVNDLQNKKQKHKYKKENAADLQRGLDEMSESDAALQDMLDRYEHETQQLQADLQRKTAQFKDLQVQLAASRKTLSARHANRASSSRTRRSTSGSSRLAPP